MKTKFYLNHFILILLLILTYGTKVSGYYDSIPSINLFGNRKLNYISKNGYVELSLSSRIIIETYFPRFATPGLIEDDKLFVAGKASLYVNFFVSDWLYAMTELRGDRGEYPEDKSLTGRMEQFFLKLTPLKNDNGSLFFQAGLFVTPFGLYPQIYNTKEDPLSRPPIMYDYRTMVCASGIPSTNDSYLAWKNKPYSPFPFREIGAPPVWAVPYQTGLMIGGHYYMFNFKAAVVNCAPSSEPEFWNERPESSDYYSYIFHSDIHLSPELKVGISYDRGPYMQPNAKGTYPAGTDMNDYIQELTGLDLTYTRGWTTIHCELIHDLWQVPNVYEDCIDYSYYFDIKQKIKPGLYGAFRYSAIDYNEILKSDGSKEKWDYDTRRLQFGLGYAINRQIEVRFEYMKNSLDGPIFNKDRNDLFTMQWIVLL